MKPILILSFLTTMALADFNTAINVGYDNYNNNYSDNTYYGNKGNAYQVKDNTVYSNDGNTYRKVGNTYYGTDGKSATIINNQVYTNY